MRFGLLAIAVVCAGGCAAYDPIAEVPNKHQVYPDTRAAIAAILGEVTPPKVYAIGEYHPTRASGANRTPMTRFTDDIIGALEPRASEMIVETWHDDCGEASLAPQLAAALGRPASTGGDIQRMVFESMRLRMRTRGLPISCLEHEAMRDRTGAIDFYRLLSLVTEKLHDTAAAAVANPRVPERPAVIVYGGAIHNDLFPRWPLETLSYAKPLARELGGGVLEIDLVVPEVVAPMQMVRDEPWFPLLGLASPGRAIVWQRGPNSYVLILPAESEAVAEIAKPRRFN